MKTLSSFKQGFLGGLGALSVAAVFFLAGSVAAQQPYTPEKDVNADGSINVVDLESVAASWGTSGNPRGTLYVFPSDITTDGNGPEVIGNGRSGMHGACEDKDPTSHFCTIEEIENAASTTGVYFDWFEGDYAWIDSLTPSAADAGTTLQPWTSDTENCAGWSSDSSGDGGAVMQWNAAGLIHAACWNTHPIVCCK